MKPQFIILENAISFCKNHEAIRKMLIARDKDKNVKAFSLKAEVEKETKSYLIIKIFVDYQTKGSNGNPDLLIHLKYTSDKYFVIHTDSKQSNHGN